MFTVLEHVDLHPYNTFGVHAKARYFAEITSTEDLIALLTDDKWCHLPRLVLGGGSNVLLTKDFDGLVILMRIQGMEVIDENQEYRFIRLGAGNDWSETVDATLAQGWCGLENLALVPGTVGGAVVQNIGAYGIEVAERVHQVEYWDANKGSLQVLGVQDCDYGYRTSVFKTNPEAQDWIVTSVVLALPKRFEPVTGYKELMAVFGDRVPETAQELADAVKAIRRKKLPDPKVLGSAGSFFKNPIVTRQKMTHLLEDTPQLVAYPLAGGRAKLAAGWLIDAVGYKGKRVGDAGIYEKQALVLVNHGQATGAELLALSQEVQTEVWRRFAVRLEPEPVII